EDLIKTHALLILNEMKTETQDNSVDLRQFSDTVYAAIQLMGNNVKSRLGTQMDIDSFINAIFQNKEASILFAELVSLQILLTDHQTRRTTSVHYIPAKEIIGYQKSINTPVKDFASFYRVSYGKILQSHSDPSSEKQSTSNKRVVFLGPYARQFHF